MAALAAWRAACGGAKDGALFRRLHRTRDKAGADIWSIGTTLTAQSVTLIYRAMLDTANAAGLLGAIVAVPLISVLWSVYSELHTKDAPVTGELPAYSSRKE